MLTPATGNNRARWAAVRCRRRTDHNHTPRDLYDRTGCSCATGPWRIVRRQTCPAWRRV